MPAALGLKFITHKQSPVCGAADSMESIAHFHGLKLFFYFLPRAASPSAVARAMADKLASGTGLFTKSRPSGTLKY